jgi:hypothetical protein
MPYGFLNFMDSGGMYGVIGGYLLGVGTMMIAVAVGWWLDGQ